MGAKPNIDMFAFPDQGNYLGRRVTVCFHRDPDMEIGGEVVRDDVEPPSRTIIKLDDGRYVLSTECQYRPE